MMEALPTAVDQHPVDSMARLPREGPATAHD